ncbi:hypothetical protein ACFL25_00025 [Patescibacteria group bacterium]
MKKILYLLVGVDLVLINLFVAYWGFRQYKDNQNPQQTSTSSISNNLTTERTKDSECPAACMSLINDLDDTKADEQVLPSPTIALINTNLSVIPVAKKTRSVSYVPVPGSGETENTDWTDIVGTDFYLSTTDYPGLVSVYFEANMRLENGNGEAFVRLYDATNSRGVDGSELTTQSQSSVFVSNGPLSIWSGNNQYRIQAKSLTADTTYFESGRLKIISEN